MIFSIDSVHLRRNLERLEGPGGRVRHRRMPRGRAEAVPVAERSGRARGAPRARAVDLPPAHFPHMFVNFSSKFQFVLGYNNGTNF